MNLWAMTRHTVRVALVMGLLATVAEAQTKQAVAESVADLRRLAPFQ